MYIWKITGIFLVISMKITKLNQKKIESALLLIAVLKTPLHCFFPNYLESLLNLKTTAKSTILTKSSFKKWVKRHGEEYKDKIFNETNILNILIKNKTLSQVTIETIPSHMLETLSPERIKLLDITQFSAKQFEEILTSVSVGRHSYTRVNKVRAFTKTSNSCTNKISRMCRLAYRSLQ